MRVVFLDIDGVLNTHRSRTLHPQDGILLDAVNLLEHTLTTTHALAVLSSTWRRIWTLEQIAARLRLPSGLLIDSTPLLDGPKARGREIDTYLSAHPIITTYAILDDDPRPFSRRQLQRLVRTYDSRGFGPREARDLEALLG